ncbi:MAG: hypothetical protein ACREH3_20205, partial [Geminicoccales bacterium]
QADRHEHDQPQAGTRRSFCAHRVWSFLAAIFSRQSLSRQRGLSARRVARQKLQLRCQFW